jgi:hypothetical protein
MVPGCKFSDLPIQRLLHIACTSKTRLKCCHMLHLEEISPLHAWSWVSFYEDAIVFLIISYVYWVLANIKDRQECHPIASRNSGCKDISTMVCPIFLETNIYLLTPTFRHHCEGLMRAETKWFTVVQRNPPQAKTLWCLSTQKLTLDHWGEASCVLQCLTWYTENLQADDDGDVAQVS